MAGLSTIILLLHAAVKRCAADEELVTGTSKEASNACV
jgi:hypothetical protein